MKKTIILLFIFLTINIYCQETLIPEKTVSFGLNKHTNRDEAFFSKIDSNNNTFLVGTTERDSTFTDILTTKLDLNYNLIWQKRHSVPTNLSYELPLKSFINNKDEIYIIGRSSFNQSRENGLIFIIKYDKNGNLIYQKNIGNTDSSDYTDYVQMDVVLNNDNDSLSLFYVTNYIHQDGTGKITGIFHLLKIDEFGTTTNSFIHEIPYYEFKALLSDNSLNILVKNVLDSSYQNFSYQLYKINNLGNISSFDIVDEPFIEFMKFSNLKDNVDFSFLNNNFYISSFNNDGYSQIKDKIYFSKFSLDGTMVYSKETTIDNKYHYLGNFKKSNEDKYTYLANNIDLNTFTSLTIDGNNEIIEAEISNNPGTGFKNNNDGTFFIPTSNSNIRLFGNDLKEINSFTTSNTYNLIDFSKLDNNTITSYGIKFDKMFPESDFYTQLDQVAEKINSSTIEKKYSFSGEGTSKAFQQSLYIDHKNDYIVLSAEKIGPQCLYVGCSSPPFDNRITKYDSNLNKLWEIDLTNEIQNITSEYNLTNLVIDSNNNIYLNVANIGSNWWNRKYSLYKIAPNGTIIYRIESTQSKEIVVNEEANKIHIISPEFSETNQTTWVTTYWTEIISFDLNSGKLIKKTIYNDKIYFSHLINNGFLYVFFIKDYIYETHILTLYKEHEIVFERALDLSYNGSVSYFKPLIKGNEVLIFTSNSGSTADKKIHTINILNEYNTYSLNSNLKKLILLNNNNILSFNEEGYLKIYNEKIEEIAKSKISYDFCCGFFLSNFNNKVLLQTFNNITIFDQSFNSIKEFKLPYLFDENFKFDKNDALVSVNNFGNSIYLHPQYAWSRGSLSKYNLNTILNITENNLPNFKENFKIFPNPTSDIFTIKLENNIIKKVLLYSIDGKLIKTFFSNKISIKKYSKGIYLLKIYTGSNTIINSKILKD